MNASKPTPKRTAVLVVHGMGSQRPLDTVRGVVKAVWSDEDAHKVWSHPEPTGTDIDLTVITTSGIPGTQNKRADFHELYWAHLLSETRGVAVLLWLFELVRRGPHLNPRMKSVWWGGAIFLALLILSVSFLVLRTIEMLSDAVDERHALIATPVLMVTVALGFALIASVRFGTHRFTVTVICGLAIIGAVIAIPFMIDDVLMTVYLSQCKSVEGVDLSEGHLVASLKLLTTYFLPFGFALVACLILMGRNGIQPLIYVFAGSMAFFIIYAGVLHWTGGTIREAVCRGWVPWSLESQWTTVAAWTVILLYVVADAAFLTPYLGDAARYFRDSPANVEGRREIRKQSVDTLAYLHDCGKYDRIVVVAHSLGTVVAYDMLRAYFSRIHKKMPDPASLGPELGELDNGIESRSEAWAKARAVIANMARVVRQGPDGAPEPKVWLVTDFVTLGSPLTHAAYLMCRGDDEDKIKKDLARRKNEREFPTCPPTKLDRDGWLTMNSLGQRFHHGAVFGLTRWTNIYFPMSQLLWGDAIGGPVGSVFCASPLKEDDTPPNHIVDVPVFTRSDETPDFFAHVKYWDAKTRDDPHIAALKAAINLADQ